ncbi:MAG: hypothetical protein M3Y28_04905 [Armatimonadota bacterium]|nr:hypothetical protein [Armatimonadota bacterium]
MNLRIFFGLALMLLCSAAMAQGPTVNDPASAQSADALLKYHLASDSDRWDADKRREIIRAMDGAVALYNRYGVFPKDVNVIYNPGTPTADASYNGSIRFGGQIGRRTAMHELAHILGVGTHPKWQSMVVDGKWTGSYAVAQLHALDGPDAVLHADRQHFWPYGLNYEKESSPESDRCHVLMVAAFRRDLGIAEGH